MVNPGFVIEHIVPHSQSTLVEAPAVSTSRTELVLRKGICAVAVVDAGKDRFPHGGHSVVAPDGSSVVTAEDLDLVLR